MKSIRRALLFAPYFLPRRRVGSMRPFRFALHLEEFGWEPTVLTIAAPGQHLTAKEKRLLRNVEIVDLRSPFDRTLSSESQLRAEKPSPPAGAGTKSALLRRSGKKGVVGTVLETLDRQFPSDTWLLLFAAKHRQLRQIVGRIQPDVLWCTGDPWSGLVAARRLAEHFGLPWVADFRDPWTLSELRSEGQWPLSRMADEYFERKVIESAHAVVFASASVEKAYRARYDAIDFESRVITNSFDSSVFNDPIAFNTTQALPVSDADGLHVGFFGRFRSLSPAALIVDALGALKRRDPTLVRRIHIHSFGSLNAADAAYAIEHDVTSCFVRENAVPLEHSLAALRRFDLLLVSTEVSREQIIPAKLFEYLAAGRPILSLSRNPEVRSILAQTGTGTQLDPLQPEAVADVLAGCLEACDNGRPLPIPFHPNAAAISKYEARETTRLLSGVFDEVTERRRARRT